MGKIDWEFIKAREGYKLNGYVPKDKHGNVIGRSGVTIGIGVDLGHMPVEELDLLPDSLADRLGRYVGLRGLVAAEVVKWVPLTVTNAEAALINDLAQKRILAPLRARFLRDSGRVFDDQDSRFMTVVASVTYQYGTPWVRTPNFWRKVVALDRLGMIIHLRDFHDDFPTRRRIEADYLAAKG